MVLLDIDMFPISILKIDAPVKEYPPVITIGRYMLKTQTNKQERIAYIFLQEKHLIQIED